MRGANSPKASDNPASPIILSFTRFSLLAGVDENFPPPDALQLENPAREPGIVLQIFANLIFVVGIDDQKRTTRQPIFLDQRSSHENEAMLNEVVHKSRMFVPKRLLARVLRYIAIWTH
jgi:hypothetical protein